MKYIDIAILDRIDVLIEKVVMANNPYDYPETTPNAPMMGVGRSGI